MALTQTQSRIIRSIKSHSGRIESLCNLSQSMTVSKSIVAKTKSDALILMGAINLINKEGGKESVQVALKVSFVPKRKTANTGSKIELLIYERIVQNLILNSNTPNVVALYGAYMCDYSDRTLPPYLQKLKTTLMNRNDNEHYLQTLDMQHTQVLVMEKADGVNMAQFLSTNPGSEVIMNVLFQILYNLLCFQQLELRHNDLHFGNVLVSTLPTPTYVNYFVDKSTFYRVDVSKGFVKIFDFERASIPYKLSNPESKGLTSKNYKYDLYSFLSRLLYLQSTPLSVKKQLRACCMSPQFSRRYDSVFALCKLNKVNKCIKAETNIPNSDLNSPIQFIQKIFDNDKYKFTLEKANLIVKKLPLYQQKKYFNNSYYLPKLTN